MIVQNNYANPSAIKTLIGIGRFTSAGTLPSPYQEILEGTPIRFKNGEMHLNGQTVSELGLASSPDRNRFLFFCQKPNARTSSYKRTLGTAAIGDSTIGIYGTRNPFINAVPVTAGLQQSSEGLIKYLFILFEDKIITANSNSRHEYLLTKNLTGGDVDDTVSIRNENLINPKLLV